MIRKCRVELNVVAAVVGVIGAEPPLVVVLVAVDLLLPTDHDSVWVIFYANHMGIDVLGVAEFGAPAILGPPKTLTGLHMYNC